jgi:DNA helicase II / ATP-dependent DNA helicase PcrA
VRQFVSTRDWKPVGVDSLEPTAEAVVRGNTNALVVAGPGAGKTELLAQRACYLLQTGVCRPPRHILAISFKTDAAANLRERVRKRCGDEGSRRFHSQTFAAFSKGLIDRFGQALPPEYRPGPDYQINFDIKKRMRVTLDDLVGDATGLTMADVSGITAKAFYEQDFVGRALPISTAAPRSVANRAAEAMWQLLLLRSAKSQLDFEMIGRLAELLVRTYPMLRKALRQTYSHVFLDEFQDTTGIQYALTRELFRGSSSVLTAVGDSKQRIMGYAGAVANVFERFKDDFGAGRHDLVMNYRSAPRLVYIQRSLIAAIEPGTPDPQPADDGKDGEGECHVYMYPDHDREAAHLAEMATRWVFEDGVHPRDICILTRKTPADYANPIIRELNTKGILSRVETDLQDLLVEPLVLVARDLISLAVRGNDRDAWASLVGVLCELRGLDEDNPRVRRVERELASRCDRLRATLDVLGCTLENMQQELQGFFAYMGLTEFRRVHPEYLQEAYFEKVFKQATEYLWKCREGVENWRQALATFAGEATIPIITIHKSKGLEYHTVVFMGLEDSAMFKFSEESDEEKRNFFVAFSRAKKRVAFTFCRKRELRTNSGGRSVSLQSRNKIGLLYQLLSDAGVQPETVQ